MDSSYGDAYSTRSSDEGYGERYGEAVKGVLDQKDTTELQRGAVAERDQHDESGKLCSIPYFAKPWFILFRFVERI